MQPGRCARGADGVGDEDETFGGKPCHQGDQGRVDVDAVGDYLQVHPVVGQCRRHRAGLAMVDRCHGVEQVRGVPGARLERRHRRLIVGVGMAYGDDDSCARAAADEGQRPVEFWGYGDDPQRALPTG